MTILGEIALAGARETLRRQQRQPLPGDSASTHDRTVRVLTPTDETLFEFLHEIGETADQFPQILGTDDRGQMACLEGTGTGGGLPAGDARMISAYHDLGRCCL
jgi:hypothetical protein